MPSSNANNDLASLSNEELVRLLAGADTGGDNTVQIIAEMDRRSRNDRALRREEEARRREAEAAGLEGEGAPAAAPGAAAAPADDGTMVIAEIASGGGGRGGVIEGAILVAGRAALAAWRANNPSPAVADDYDDDDDDDDAEIRAIRARILRRNAEINRTLDDLQQGREADERERAALERAALEATELDGRGGVIDGAIQPGSAPTVGNGFNDAGGAPAARGPNRFDSIMDMMESMRQDFRNFRQEGGAAMAAVEAELGALRRENADLRQSNQALEQRNGALEQRNGALERRMAAAREHLLGSDGAGEDGSDDDLIEEDVDCVLV